MHESSRAQPFLLRSFQCFPAPTSSQYLHLVRARVFFGVFLRRRAQKFLKFEWRLRANGFGVREYGQGRLGAGAAGELRHVRLTTRPRSERAEVQITAPASPHHTRIGKPGKHVSLIFEGWWHQSIRGVAILGNGWMKYGVCDRPAVP